MYISYPAIFYKANDTKGYFVEFPDFEGSTFGEDETETFEMATDLLGMELIDAFVGNKDFPKRTPIKDVEIPYNENAVMEESFVSLVGIDLAEYAKNNESKTVRKNVSLPSYLNEMAKNNNINVSQVLQEALKEKFEIE